MNSISFQTTFKTYKTQILIKTFLVPVNATFWSPWGSWSTCNLTCGGGYRQRTRKSMFPDSEVVASFAGWSSEEERCNTFECEESERFICLY